jgi:hypothetical protein
LQFKLARQVAAPKAAVTAGLLFWPFQFCEVSSCNRTLEFIGESGNPGPNHLERLTFVMTPENIEVI